MGKPSAPPAPDYAAAAQAQGVANVDAARTSAKLSNPNVINPYGTQTVTYGAGKVFDEAGYNKAMQDYLAKSSQPSAPISRVRPEDFEGQDNPIRRYNEAKAREVQEAAKVGAQPAAPTRDMFTKDNDPDRVTVTQTLSPEQQKLFDQQNRISQGMGDLAESSIGRVDKLLGTEFDASNLPAMNSGIAPTNVQSRSGQVQTDIAAPSRGVQYDIASPATGIQGAVDRRFDQSGGQVQETLYRQQARMLDPQYQQQSADLESRLANQGIMQGSEAYNREMDNFARQRDSAYADARDRAILAGGNEQSRLFNLGLASADLANRANELEFGQGTARAGFSNAANAQEFGQNLDRGNFRNTAVGQQFNQDATAANQNFAQGLASAQFGNQARQQALQEQLALRQLPLNEINALRSGSQVTVPQFQGYSGTQVAPANIMGATQAQGQWDQGLYNAKSATASGNMQAGASVAAAAIAAF